jgi:hypothetical protein
MDDGLAARLRCNAEFLMREWSCNPGGEALLPWSRHELRRTVFASLVAPEGGGSNGVT